MTIFNLAQMLTIQFLNYYISTPETTTMVFASPSGQFYRDVTTSYHLPGLSHLDNFIVTRKSCPLTGTLQKHVPYPPCTGTNSRLKYRDPARMRHRVTQPPFIAGRYT